MAYLILHKDIIMGMIWKCHHYDKIFFNIDASIWQHNQQNIAYVLGLHLWSKGKLLSMTKMRNSMKNFQAL